MKNVLVIASKMMQMLREKGDGQPEEVFVRMK